MVFWKRQDIEPGVTEEDWLEYEEFGEQGPQEGIAEEDWQRYEEFGDPIGEGIAEQDWLDYEKLPSAKKPDEPWSIDFGEAGESWGNRSDFMYTDLHGKRRHLHGMTAGDWENWEDIGDKGSLDERLKALGISHEYGADRNAKAFMLRAIAQDWIDEGFAAQSPGLMEDPVGQAEEWASEIGSEALGSLVGAEEAQELFDSFGIKHPYAINGLIEKAKKHGVSRGDIRALKAEALNLLTEREGMPLMFEEEEDDGWWATAMKDGGNLGIFFAAVPASLALSAAQDLENLAEGMPVGAPGMPQGKKHRLAYAMALDVPEVERMLQNMKVSGSAPRLTPWGPANFDEQTLASIDGGITSLANMALLLNKPPGEILEQIVRARDLERKDADGNVVEKTNRADLIESYLGWLTSPMEQRAIRKQYRVEDSPVADALGPLASEDDIWKRLPPQYKKPIEDHFIEMSTLAAKEEGVTPFVKEKFAEGGLETMTIGEMVEAEKEDLMAGVETIGRILDYAGKEKGDVPFSKRLMEVVAGHHGYDEMFEDLNPQQKVAVTNYLEHKRKSALLRHEELRESRLWDTASPGAGILLRGLEDMLLGKGRMEGFVSYDPANPLGVAYDPDDPAGMHHAKDFKKALILSIGNAVASESEGTIQQLALEGHFGQYFKEHPGNLNSLINKAMFEQAGHLRGSTSLTELYIKDLAHGMTVGLAEEIEKSTVGWAGAVWKKAITGDPLTKLEREGWEKFTDHTIMWALDVSIVGALLSRGIKHTITAKHRAVRKSKELEAKYPEGVPSTPFKDIKPRYKRWEETPDAIKQRKEREDAATGEPGTPEAVPVPDNLTRSALMRLPERVFPAAAKVARNLEEAVTFPLKVGSTPFADLPKLLTGRIASTKELVASGGYGLLDALRRETSLAARQPIREAVAQKRVIETADGIPIDGEIVVDSLGVARVEVPVAQEAGEIGPGWREQLARDPNAFKGARSLESFREALEEVTESAEFKVLNRVFERSHRLEFEVLRDEAAKLRQMGQGRVAGMLENLAEGTVARENTRAELARIKDLINKRERNVLAASVRARVVSMNKRAAEEAKAVGNELGTGPKKPLEEQSLAEKGQREEASNLYRDIQERVLESRWERNAPQREQAAAALDAREIDIAQSMGMRLGSKSVIDAAQNAAARDVLLREYRATHSPTRRGMELAIRGVVDPLIYDSLGLSFMDNYSNVYWGMKMKASETEAMAKTGSRDVSGKQVAHLRLNETEQQIADSLNMTLSEWREKQGIRTRAFNLMKHGETRPSVYQALGANPADAVTFAAEAAAHHGKPYVLPKRNPTEEISPSREVAIKTDPKGDPYGEGISTLERLSRAFLTKKAVETWSGKTIPVVEGMELGPKTRKVWAVAEYLRRPFAFVNVPDWVGDWVGDMLADHGAGKIQLSGGVMGVLWNLNKPSKKMGKEAHYVARRATSDSVFYLQKLEWVLNELSGKPKKELRFTEEEVASMLDELGMADQMEAFGGQLKTKGGMVAKIAEIDRLANATKRLAEDYIIETVDGNPVFLKDVVELHLKFQGRWMKMEELNDSVNRGFISKKYAYSGVSDFQYMPKKSLSDMTDLQRTAILVANKYVRPVERVFWDMAVEASVADDALRMSIKDGQVQGAHLLDLKKDAIKRAATWMSDYYDPRAVNTLILDTIVKMSENVNEITLNSTLQNIDQYLGRVMPGAFTKAGRGRNLPASKLLEEYLQTKDMKDLANEGQYSAIIERYWRSKLWEDLPYQDKITMGLHDFREATKTVALRYGQALAHQRMLVWGRENGLLRTKAEVRDEAVTPKEVRNRYVEVGKPTLISAPGKWGKAYKKALEDITADKPIWGDMEGFLIHEFLNDQLVRQKVLFAKSDTFLSKIATKIKQGYVVSPDTMIRAYFQNAFVFGNIADIPFKMTHMADARRMIQNARKKGVVSRELEQARREGYGSSSQVKAEFLTDEGWLDLQYSVMESVGPEALAKLRSKDLSEFADSATTLLELTASKSKAKKTDISSFVEGRRLHQMRDPIFLRERGIKPTIASSIKKEIGAVGKKGGETYGFIDDYFKLSYILQLTRDHGLTIRQAVRKADQVFMDYADVSPIVEAMSGEVLLPWGVPFIRFQVKAVQKATELVAEYPQKSFFWLQWMEAHMYATAQILDRDESELRKMTATTDQIILPMLTTDINTSDKGALASIPVTVGYAGLNRGAYSLLGSYSKDLRYLSQLPTNAGEWSGFLNGIGAAAPEGGVLWNLLKELSQGLVHDRNPDLLNPYGSFTEKHLRGLSPSIIRSAWSFWNDEISWERYAARIMGISGKVVSPIEQVLLEEKTLDRRMGALRDYAKGIERKYAKWKSSPDTMEAPTEKEVKVAAFLQETVIFPWYGVDGHGPRGKRGKRGRGWKGELPIKDIIKYKRNQEKRKEWEIALPFYAAAIKSGDWIPSEYGDIKLQRFLKDIYPEYKLKP